MALRDLLIDWLVHLLAGIYANASSMSDGGTCADGSRLQKRQRAAYLKLIAAIQLRRGSLKRKSASAAAEVSQPTFSNPSDCALGADDDEQL